MQKTVTVKADENENEIIREQEKNGYTLVGRDGRRLIFESADRSGRTALNG